MREDEHLQLWEKNIEKRKQAIQKEKKRKQEMEDMQLYKKELLQEKEQKKAQHLASLQQQRIANRKKIMEKTDGYATTAATGKGEKLRRVHLEE